MKNTFEPGFTLIEMMTAVSIFIVVMVVASGAILTVFDANKKAQSLRAALNNVNLAVEDISREARFGVNYHCGTSGNITQPQNCPAGDTYLSFLAATGNQEVYRLNGTAIERSLDGGQTFIALTSPEVTIQSLTFYVLGAGAVPTNYLQPKILVKIKGYAGTAANTRTDFTLETLVSERALDK